MSLDRHLGRHIDSKTAAEAEAAAIRVSIDHGTFRSRRLEEGEAERLLTTSGPHLRALAEAALESGARLGEFLSLQWWQVRGTPRRELFFPAGKTKTMEGRTVLVSSRLQAVLDMRRTDPAGQPHGPDAYVFGNEIGQRVTTIKTAWRLACRRAKIEGWAGVSAYALRPSPDGKGPLRSRAAPVWPASKHRVDRPVGYCNHQPDDRGGLS